MSSSTFINSLSSKMPEELKGIEPNVIFVVSSIILFNQTYIVLLKEKTVKRTVSHKIKNTSNKIKRHTNVQPGKPICFPYTKK